MQRTLLARTRVRRECIYPAPVTLEAPPAKTRSVLLDHLAANLKTVKTHFGWTLPELAARSGVTKSLLKHLANGRGNPGISTILRIADAAGLPIEDLMERRVHPRNLRRRERAMYRDPNAIIAAMCSHIRACRVRNRWSVGELAARTGICKNTMHNLEVNKFDPTVSIVENVARAFGTTFSALIKAAMSPVLAVGPKNGFPIQTAAGQKQLLCDLSFGSMLDLTECRVDGAHSIESAPVPAITMLYVLSGSIRIRFDADSLVLNKGNAIMISDHRRHAISSATVAPARFIRVQRIVAK